MDISGVTDTLTTCLIFHGNELLNRVEDERDFLRSWRRRWRDAVASENLRMLRFLQSAAAAAGDATEFATNTREMPPNSDWFARNVTRNAFDLSGVMLDLEERLGVDYIELRTANHLAFDRYVVVLRELFELEDTLNRKLGVVHTLSQQLESLPMIDLSGAETAELQTAILRYIRGVYREHSIEDTYRAFIRCYAEWHALRGLVLGGHVARAEANGGPLCSICTTEKITSALVPCGHTFCNNCSQRQQHICYVCRTAVRERMRVYFI